MAPSPRNRFSNNYQSDDIISHNIGNSSSLGSADTISPNRHDDSSTFPRGAIIGIVVAGVLVILAVAAFAIIRLRRRRTGVGAYRAANARGGFKAREAPTQETEEIKPGDESENATASQGLLRHADAPAIVAWTADEDTELQTAGSTQDGFAYSRGAGGIQRPASVASFSSLGTVAPPPCYEEATSSSGHGARRNSDGGLGPLVMGQGDDGGEVGGRGRSTSRERRLGTDRTGRTGGSRPRSSINGDRRRSVSRFREEGMVSLNLHSGG
ncbi:hypothetical protein RBB50_007412 [Rhinocladiella similis]